MLDPKIDVATAHRKIRHYFPKILNKNGVKREKIAIYDFEDKESCDESEVRSAIAEDKTERTKKELDTSDLVTRISKGNKSNSNSSMLSFGTNSLSPQKIIFKSQAATSREELIKSLIKVTKRGLANYDGIPGEDDMYLEEARRTLINFTRFDGMKEQEDHTNNKSANKNRNVAAKENPDTGQIIKSQKFVCT